VRARARSAAFTFGAWRKNYVCLDSGLVSEFFTRRGIFNAKLRHELAHFRNKDINKTGVTMGSWWVFATVGPAVLLYCLATQPRSWDTIGALSMRLAVIAAVVYLARKAVIRSRE
jgi:Zn-dependent protease with chaperone function